MYRCTSLIRNDSDKNGAFLRGGSVLEFENGHPTVFRERSYFYFFGSKPPENHMNLMWVFTQCDSYLNSPRFFAYFTLPISHFPVRFLEF